MERAVVIGWTGHRRRRFGRCHAEQFTAASELTFTLAIAEKAEVSDAMEAIRQDVDEEAADELVGGQRHRAVMAVMAVVLVWGFLRQAEF